MPLSWVVFASELAKYSTFNFLCHLIFPCNKYSVPNQAADKVVPARSNSCIFAFWGRSEEIVAERRGNRTDRSVTDPDCRFVSKGNSSTGMRIAIESCLELGVEVFRGSTSEEDGARSLRDRAK